MKTIQEITEHFTNANGALLPSERRRIISQSQFLNGGLPADGLQNEQLPEGLSQLVEKIATSAETIVDADFDDLRGDYTEEQLYEVLIAATVGSANARFALAMQHIENVF